MIMARWLTSGAEANPPTAGGHREITTFMACASRFPWSLLTFCTMPAISGTVSSQSHFCLQ
jgi:hypothetical protein